MIVYGDPSSCGPLNRLVSESLRTATAPVRADRLDAVRDLLIRLGQAEQAAEDAPDLDPGLLVRIRSATDVAADAFCATRLGRADAEVRLQDAMTRAAELAADATIPDVPARMKVPEGFAFYALFPEQYAEAGARWASARLADRATSSIAVIGIRSIGTSLSALVRATLAAEKWNVHRFTLRPSGHPFDRQVTISPDELRGAAFAIIVDEGPGASGSSMAAVARAAVQAGLEPERVCFFPGHSGEPGPNASDKVRRWWQRIERYVVPVDALQWNGRSLPDHLADRTSQLLGDGARTERIEDLSGGRWREMLWAVAADQPPVFPTFERAKYQCVLADGRAVLWKFAGLAGSAERVLSELQARARLGWTAAPLGRAFGFVATPWIDGTPLAREDLTDDLLARVGRYIRESAGPPLSMEEQSDAFARLREMLYWNTWEAFGEQVADSTRALADAAGCVRDRQPTDSYGDGRLGPCEWIRAASGTILKVDCAGHDADHTMISRQPVAWDAAGAAVEWDLDDAGVALLQRAAGLTEVPRELMDFYRASYAAFRAGMASMCGVDLAFYGDQLRRVRRRANEMSGSQDS